MEQLDQRVNLAERVHWELPVPWVREECQEREDAQGQVVYLVCVVLKEMLGNQVQWVLWDLADLQAILEHQV